LAGDWIKFELATIDKPEVLQMAEILGTTSDDVVGKLLRVWGWFDQRSINGDAGGVTSVTLMKFIDRHVGSNGFAACMKKVGWLTDDGLPNFERHNGETAKNRALTNKRMKRMRNAGVTQEASPEKRREEKKEKQHAAVAAVPDWLPGDAWQSFAEMRAKIRAPLTDKAKTLALAELGKLRDQGHDPRAVLEQSVMNGWRGLFPLKAGPAKAFPSYT
jgi:hypothetical protein